MPTSGTISDSVEIEISTPNIGVSTTESYTKDNLQRLRQRTTGNGDMARKLRIVASDTLSHFRRGLKTFLFRQSYSSILFSS